MREEELKKEADQWAAKEQAQKQAQQLEQQGELKARFTQQIAQVKATHEKTQQQINNLKQARLPPVHPTLTIINRSSPDILSATTPVKYR